MEVKADQIVVLIRDGDKYFPVVATEENGKLLQNIVHLALGQVEGSVYKGMEFVIKEGAK